MDQTTQQNASGYGWLGDATTTVFGTGFSDVFFTAFGQWAANEVFGDTGSNYGSQTNGTVPTDPAAQQQPPTPIATVAGFNIGTTEILIFAALIVVVLMFKGSK